MPLFPVTAAKERDLLRRMEALEIRDEDLEEEFIRSSGPGGQKVNKSSSCVMLLHRPSGIRIKCMMDRSQGLNRFFARRMLVEKLEAKLLGSSSDEARRVAKVRKQKDRRRRRGNKKEIPGGESQ